MLTENMNEIISIIESKCGPNFTLLTSFLISGMCYISGEIYDEKEDIVCCDVEGSFNSYPYNTIQYHKENQWIFDCIQFLYYVRMNVIPHSLSNKHHNLPLIVSVPRSNGDIHDGLLIDSNIGIRLRKSNSVNNNTTEQIYVRIQWIDDISKLDPSKINEYKNYRNVSFKDVTLENFISVNPNIAKTGITLIFKRLQYPLYSTETQRNVIKYCNNEFKKWIETKINPQIERYKDIVKIKYIII